jgi:hypothetical protein
LTDPRNDGAFGRHLSQHQISNQSYHLGHISKSFTHHHIMDAATDDTVQVSFAMPYSLDTKIHLRLAVKSKVIVLFITTVASDDIGKPVPMGSFVYALPDVSLSILQ